MTDMNHHDDGPRRSDPPEPQPIEPAGPPDFGRVQVWWGDGKGKTTAALGMGFRAAGHGYRVHLLQFMKGGASSVEDVRGECNAIAAMPSVSYENTGHYGWHGFRDETDDDDHVAKAKGGLERAREILAGSAAAQLTGPLDLDGPPENGVHMLILDEILYAANRGLLDPEDVIGLIEDRPDGLELVLTGSHDRPEYLAEHADLVTNVRKNKHHFDEGGRARKGTEF